MSCGCSTIGEAKNSCGTKNHSGCAKVDICSNSYKLSIFDWLSGVQTPNKETNQYVEVRFKNDRKAIYKNTNNLSLHIGSTVTVEANPGHDVGVVSLTGALVEIQLKKKDYSEDQILKIYRISTQKDIEIWQNCRKLEDSAKMQARKIALNLKLEMKISDLEYQGDGSKITFYYTADGRVDFRQLIKEFATNFKAKIDMKQIGYRQEAAKIGGIGSCGRELCCSTWLTDFRSVNTNAARYQQLSINPVKLAGQCGKLKCCLNFELDSYVDALSDFPSSNTILETEKGKAFCIKIDVFKKKMWFAYVENSMLWFDLNIKDVKEIIKQNKNGVKSAPLEEIKIPENISTVDLIQESNMDRFEKKSKNRNPINKKNNTRQNSAKNSSDKKIIEQRLDKSQKQNIEVKSKQEPVKKDTQTKQQVSQPRNERIHKIKPSNKSPEINLANKNTKPLQEGNQQKKQNEGEKPKHRNFKKKYPPKRDNNAE